MTTQVTIKANDFPVRVVAIDPKTRLKLKNIPNEFVDKNCELTVNIWDSKAIIVTEIKK